MNHSQIVGDETSVLHAPVVEETPVYFLCYFSLLLLVVCYCVPHEYLPILHNVALLIVRQAQTRTACLHFWCIPIAYDKLSEELQNIPGTRFVSKPTRYSETWPIYHTFGA